MKKIAFICVHNACRSQIAEALCRIYRKDLIAFSAGTQKLSQINADAVRIMRDKYGVDMSKQYSKLISDIPACDIYVSMGCNVGCPFIGRAFDFNFNIHDPTGKSDERFIAAIEKIKEKILAI